MIKDITIGQYIPGNSALHRIDPRAKVLLVMVFVTLLFVARGIYSYMLLAMLAFTLIWVSRISPRFILRGLKPLLIILSLTLFLHFFLTKGGVLLFSIGPFSVYSQGVITGLYMAGRLILLIMVTSLLTLTTSPIALTDALERLLGPFRRIGVPAHELAMMMTIALRFIPTLIEETEKIMKAQMARGADFESGNIFKRAKSLIPLLVPLFVSAFRRADELAMAMEARCYRGGEHRTRMKVLKTTSVDYWATVVMLCFSVVIIGLRVV